MSESCVYKTQKRQDGAHVKEFEDAINEMIKAGNKDIVLDMDDTVYISSVTLRVILKAQKQLMAQGGKLALRNVHDSVMEVLDLVGFSGILTVEGA